MSLLSILLNVAYALLLVVVFPIVVYRMLVLRKYRDGWGQKLLGNLPRRETARACVWFHAVSVGEVLQLQRVVRELTERQAQCEVLITTTTHTGLAVAQEKFPEHQACYFPLDFSWAVRRAIRRVQPAAIVLVELELWPNLILEAGRQEIPLALINGRISEKSFQGYRRIRLLMRRLLLRFDVLAVQSDDYAERLIELGAPEDRVHVTGSIKFDGVNSDRENDKTAELRSAFGLGDDERVFVAGSTHAPEEEIALTAYQALRHEFPELRLILVPRHQERFEEAARLVQSHNLPLLRRTETLSGLADGNANRREPSSPPILLLDTLGELSACWGLADVAYVGGSLTNRGGQNMIEPAAYGAAVLFGPNTQNFRDVVALLLAGQAARVVPHGQGLTEAVRDCLTDQVTAQEMGRRAQQLVLAQQGATKKTIELIEQLLPHTTSEHGSRAA